MTRAIIYARVSTEDQVEKYGLPVQLRACRDRAASGDLNIVEEITDDGVSGTIMERPGLNRLRQMVRSGSADVVLMLDVDRLSRELAHLLILKPEIERHARLEFVTAKFEDSPSGRMFFGIRGAIAQYERELTRERTMRGKRERARAGLIVGGRTAYGYTYAGGILHEDMERAPVVRRIFDSYDAGMSLRGITFALRTDGVPTWSGRKWGKSSVRRILANETYAGIAYYGAHRREGTVLRLREPSERIALATPALVSREQWERVQARLASNPMAGRPSTGFLLRGLLRCALCGRKMYGQRGRNERSYRCEGRDRLRHAENLCRNHVQAGRLDSAAWRAIVRTFADTSALQGAIAKREIELRAPGVNLDDLRQRIVRLKRKEDAALNAMLDPDLAAARSAIKAEYKASSQERRRLEADLAAYEAADRRRLPSSEWIEDTAATIRIFVVEMTEAAMRQQFVQRLVSRAEWDGEEIRMSCFVDAKLATTSTHCGCLPPRPEERASLSSAPARRGNPEPIPKPARLPRARKDGRAQSLPIR